MMIIAPALLLVMPAIALPLLTSVLAVELVVAFELVAAGEAY